MKRILAMTSALAALLTFQPRAAQLESYTPRPAGGYAPPRSKVKRAPRPREFSMDHDPRSNGGGPKLQRKAAEGKL